MSGSEDGVLTPEDLQIVQGASLPPVKKPKSNKLSGTAIALIAVVTLVAVTAIIVTIVLVLKKKRSVTIDERYNTYAQYEKPPPVVREKEPSCQAPPQKPTTMKNDIAKPELPPNEEDGMIVTKDMLDDVTEDKTVDDVKKDIAMDAEREKQSLYKPGFSKQQASKMLAQMNSREKGSIEMPHLCTEDEIIPSEPAKNASSKPTQFEYSGADIQGSGEVKMEEDELNDTD